MRYILISNGDFDKRTAEKIDWSCSKKVCVDGGIRHFYRLGIEPDVIIGDLDSADSETLEYYRSRGVEIVQYPTKKDETDTEIAVEYGLERGADEFLLLGATGSRMDHTLGCISLLYRLRIQGVDAKVIDLDNEISIVSGEHELDRGEDYRYVSLIPYGGDVKGVTLRGFEYGLTERDFSVSDTIGISNEIKDSKAKIKIDSGYMVLLRSR
jgi:thiamine pyrophosphokinase